MHVALCARCQSDLDPRLERNENYTNVFVHGEKNNKRVSARKKIAGTKSLKSESCQKNYVVLALQHAPSASLEVGKGGGGGGQAPI